MITPIEIQSKVFKSGLGYDKKEVDHFMAEILADYEKLYKDNVELQDKLGVVNEGLQYYKTIEKTLQKALILAEKVAEETKETAKENAKNIEMEAKNKAQMIVSDAQNQLKRLHEQTLSVIRQYDIYKAQYKQMAMTQLEILNSDSFNLNIANLDVFADSSNVEKLNTEALGSKEKVSDNKKESINQNSNKDNNLIDSAKPQETNQSKQTNTEEEYDESFPHLSEEEIRALVLADEAQYYG